MRKETETLRSALFALGAVICWGSLIAFSRSLTELLGKYTAGGCIAIAASVVCFFLFTPKKRKFSLFYHGLGGCCITLYFLAFNISLGMAANRVQAVEMGLINYLWPFLTLIVSLIWFRQKCSFPLLIAGMALTMAGLLISTATLSGISWHPREIWAHIAASPLPYLVMLTAAVSWAFYSVIVTAASRKMETDALPYFMLAAGILLFSLRFPAGETSCWNFSAAWQLVLTALIPLAAGYACWDKAMIASNTFPAIMISYLTPLCSAFASAIILHLALPWEFYAASLCVIAGALICRLGVRTEKPSQG